MPADVNPKDASSDQTKSTSRADEFVANVLRKGQVVSHLGHRVLQWQLTTGHKQWQAKRDGLFHGDPSVIEFAGDYQLLASCLSYTSSTAGFEVQRFIEAQAFSEWKFADGSHGNMIILNFLPSSMGKAGRIRIKTGLMFSVLRKTRTEWWT